MSTNSERLLKALAFEIEQLEAKRREADEVAHMEMDKRRALEIKLKEREDELRELA